MSAADQIPVKSPLSISGVFIDILRRRFRAENNLAWVYAPGEEARLTNTISIEGGGNPLHEERNKRPAIYVVRGPISYQESVIGNKNTSWLQTSATAYYATANTSFTFITESNQEGEACLIADVVLSTLMMGAAPIERAFMFRKLGPFSVSTVNRPVHDTTFAQVHVSMGLTFDVRWGTLPIAPILQEVVVDSINTNYNSSEEYFSNLYLNSLGGD